MLTHTFHIFQAYHNETSPFGPYWWVALALQRRTMQVVEFRTHRRGDIHCQCGVRPSLIGAVAGEELCKIKDRWQRANRSQTHLLHIFDKYFNGLIPGIPLCCDNEDERMDVTVEANDNNDDVECNDEEDAAAAGGVGGRPSQAFENLAACR